MFVELGRITELFGAMRTLNFGMRIEMDSGSGDVAIGLKINEFQHCLKYI